MNHYQGTTTRCILQSYASDVVHIHTIRDQAPPGAFRVPVLFPNGQLGQIEYRFVSVAGDRAWYEEMPF